MSSTLILIFIQLFGIFCCNSTDVNIPFDHHFHTEPILPFNTWSTFRGLHYFGLRSSSPDSPAIGLIWLTNDSNNVNSIKLRHYCNANDGITYGWKSHNFQDFGFQQILDKDYALNTSFIKRSADNWRAQVSVGSVNATKNKIPSISLIIYLITQRAEDSIKTITAKHNSIQLQGNNEYTGHFSVNIDVFGNQQLFGGHFETVSPIGDIVKTLKNNLKPIEVNGTHIYVLKNQSIENKPNLIAFQTVFESHSKLQIDFKTKQLFETNDENYEKLLEERIQTFDREFEHKFGLKSKGFNKTQISFAKSILSEMLGSIAFFNGNQSVDSPGMKSPKWYGPLQMLSAVPSRSVFPHPFLWDEGFHNLLIQRWNSSLTLSIMKSWFNLMNINGWIPREITIGNELISWFGSFNTQHETNANPPSFLLTIDSLMRNNQIDTNYLKTLYPRLKAWFQWYNTSQIGAIKGTYRWRGRDPDLDDKYLNPDTLTSGLDDFPRATHPTDSEYHLDLRCWIALASDIMSRIAKTLGDLSAKVKYQETTRLLSDNSLLDRLHWSEQHKAYCDYGLHSTNVSLIRDTKRGLIRKVWTLPQYQLTCDQLGYVNIFPLMFGLIDANNSKLTHVLDSISNSSEMWSPYGLRSISKTSPYYNKYNNEHDFPYWRGPVWVNINYLVLKGLRHYSQTPGPNQMRAQTLYKELRNCLIENMYKEYQRTGFVWEQYNDVTGLGQRSHPFVGWSALIVLIMTEDY